MSRMEGLFTAWGRILGGRTPNLSIEITRECPLRCPGCYAFGDDHLGGEVTLRQVADYKGDALVQRMLQLVDEHKPVHLSIVGGEPLVRFRELNTLLPILAARGLHTQLVTSAVRPIPIAWAQLPRLQVVVSIDGLQPEHDVRRKPATYDRILKHIAGHQITVHCTVTRQQVQRDGYLEEFVQFWSANQETRQIWVSLYTPQLGETAPEILTPADRERVVAGAAPPAGELSEAQDAEGPDRGLSEAAVLAGRVRVRPDHDQPVGRPRAPDHPVPVRRQSGLHPVRLHRHRRPRGGRPPQAARPHLRSAPSTGRRCGSASGCAGPAGPWPGRLRAA